MVRLPQPNLTCSPKLQFRKILSLKAEYFKLWWQENSLNREIWIWGYGKEVFKKTEHHSYLDIEIKGFIDVIERPAAVRKVKTYHSVKKSKVQFYLIYVSDREGKLKIAEYISAQKMTVNED
jgi:hypothetical protein